MKSLHSALLALSISALALSSCTKEPQRHKEPQMPHEFTEFSDAGAFYYGKFQNYDFNMFCLYLLSSDTRADNGKVSGIGTALWLDMNVAANEGNTIPPDNYSPARNDLDYPAFLKGSLGEDGQTVSGSYIYHRTLEGRAEYKLITNGSVKINFSGTKIKVDAQVVADNETYTFNYEGFFSYTDLVESPSEPDKPDPDEPSGGETPPANYSYGYLYDFGQDFGTSVVSDYRLWRICLADKNFDLDTMTGEGKELQLELVSSANATDVAGQYKVLTKDFPGDDLGKVLKSGSALCGYFEENDNKDVEENDDKDVEENEENDDKEKTTTKTYYGCWFFENSSESSWLGATSGTVEVYNRGNGQYHVVYDLFDDYSGGTRFRDTYNGPLTLKTTGTKSTFGRADLSRKVSPTQSRRHQTTKH